MRKESIFRMVLFLGIAFMVYKFGFQPVMTGEAFGSSAKKIDAWASGKLTREDGKYDVIVIGEEPEGIAAAVSASRVGAKTLLVAKGDDLGGAVSRALQPDLEFTTNGEGGTINGGISSELYKKLDKEFTVEKYIQTVNDMVKEEKTLEIVYGAQKISPISLNNTVTGVEVLIKSGKKSYYGKRFIDATLDGSLMAQAGVPYFNGSEDLNLKNSFQPVRLNFVMEGIKWDEVKTILNMRGGEFYQIVGRYEPEHHRINIRNFKLLDMGGGKVIVQGLQVYGMNLADDAAMAQKYREAVQEAKSFSLFLSATLKVFKDAKFVKAADEFFIRENRHFLGEYLLNVNDVLENKDFEDKIAMACFPVDAGKFMEGGNKSYVVGMPSGYGIPIGCIIPQKVDNLLMAGSKASYSSLAATSASTKGTDIALGEAAGVAAVYSIVQNIAPRDIIAIKEEGRTKEVGTLLKRQGVRFSRPKDDDKNDVSGEWVYPQLKKLRTLGLVSGGSKNDFRLKEPVTQEDLALLLINGVYRTSADKYSLDVDARVRKLTGKDKLTKEKAAHILSALHGVETDLQGAYAKACELGFIDKTMQQRLSGKQQLEVEDAIYLGAQNIELFTKKKIQD